MELNILPSFLGMPWSIAIFIHKLTKNPTFSCNSYNPFRPEKVAVAKPHGMEIMRAWCLDRAAIVEVEY